MRTTDDPLVKAKDFRVVATRPIVYDDPGLDHQYVVPEGMEGTCRGASKVYTKDVRLLVYWDAVAAWTPESDPPNRSWIITWWEDCEVRPSDVRVIALVPEKEAA